MHVTSASGLNKVVIDTVYTPLSLARVQNDLFFVVFAKKKLNIYIQNYKLLAVIGQCQ